MNPYEISDCQSCPVLPITALPQRRQDDVRPTAIDCGLPSAVRVLP